MTQYAEILAVGARTPVGLTAESAAAAIRAGVSRLGDHPFLVDGAGEMVRVARDARLDPLLLGASRMAPIALSAVSESLAKLPAAELGPLALLLVLPETRPGFSDQDAAEVTRGLVAALPPAISRVEVVGRGHAGGLQALAAARQRVERDAGAVVIVGVDSYLDPRTLEWLESDRRLASADTRAGFTPGEAAGALIVASEALRRRIGAAPLARIRGAASASESQTIHSEGEVLGVGLAAAIAGALRGLALPDERADAIYCDINGERYRSEEWGFAALRLGESLRDSAYETSTDGWGDVGAASGVLGCVLAAQAWARGCAAGPRALVWAGSESGLRGAAVLEKVE